MKTVNQQFGVKQSHKHDKNVVHRNFGTFLYPKGLEFKLIVLVKQLA